MDHPVVIITGGGRGIGFGIAQCFARRGATLVIADANSEAAESAARELGARGGATLGLGCDITRREQVAAVIAATVERFGRIDVLVNNAGICPFQEIMAMTPEVWQRTLDVNLTGAFHFTQLVGQEMIRAGTPGRIVFVTSLATDITAANQVDYAASKAGLRMTMKGFAAALGPHGITCNAVAPGMILTKMTEHHWAQPGPAEYIKTRVPTGRIGTPEDVGNAAVFLASPEAAYISGTTIRVDGGFCVSNR